ncbi:MAG: hypothetical protein GWO86_02500 [Planctomycetes bacterium]|nr:hypothetical protein [Planctomycetota bacterium]
MMNNPVFRFVFLAAAALIVGCSGYSNQSLYSRDVRSVYVEMFENTSFRRDVEYELTDAIAKRIEAETPYKIISDRSRADTIISGKITSLSASTVSIEPETGRAIESQAEVIANFSWKNLRTGEYLVESTNVSAAAGYVEFQEQSFGNAAKVAVSRLAERIVELMQTEW